MRVFAPRIEVRLIKTNRRQDLGDSGAAASRFGTLRSLNLTAYLPDGGAVHVERSVSAPAGGFFFTLADIMVPGYNESLYGLIEPMDMIEIRMAHEPDAAQYKGSSGRNAYKLPVVMRGFVSRISRRRSMAGGQPARVIQVSGHDFGKILQTLQIFYLNNSAVGDNVVSGLKFFTKFAGPDEAKIMSTMDFTNLVLERIINPYLETLTKGADGSDVEAAAISQVASDVSTSGAVSPLAVANFEGGSVYDFLARYLDVGVWNELFLDDREEGVYLVARPNPFRSLAGHAIQAGATSDEITIDASDVEEITEGRSDSGVANYFWVTNSGWQLRQNHTQQMLASTASTDSFVLFDYENTQAARFGVRKMEVASYTGSLDLQNSDATLAANAPAETDRLAAWLADRRRILAEQNKDNVILEGGSMVVRGNERIKRGMHLTVDYGGFKATYYVTAVAHQFTPFVAFKTMVTYERGTGYATRGRMNGAPYLSELNAKGVL